MTLAYPSLMEDRAIDNLRESMMPSSGSFVASGPGGYGTPNGMYAGYSAYGQQQGPAYAQPHYSAQHPGYGVPTTPGQDPYQPQAYGGYGSYGSYSPYGSYGSYGSYGYGAANQPAYLGTAASYGTATAASYGAEAGGPNPLPTTGSFAAVPPLGTYGNLDPYSGYSSPMPGGAGFLSQQSFAFTQPQINPYQFQFYADYKDDHHADLFAGQVKPPPASLDKENKMPERMKPIEKSGDIAPLKPPAPKNVMPKRAPKAAAKKQKGFCGCG